MSYLSIEKSLKLLEESELIFNKSSIKIYSTNKGEKFMIKSSKLYEGGISYWFGITPSSLKIARENSINFFCFTIGYEGIIRLPINLLYEYIESADKSEDKEKKLIKHYHIRIKYDDDIILYNSKKKYSISDYLIYDIETVLSDLNSTQISDIKKDAENFSDYEIQYYESERKTKYRKESKAQKERIAILENHTCQICNYRYEYLNKLGNKAWIIEVDHIIDKSHGGGETIDNLWVLCPNCHTKKTKGIISIDKTKQAVFENGQRIEYNDNHLGWKASLHNVV